MFTHLHRHSDSQFSDLIKLDPDTDCWLWTGFIMKSNGYAYRSGRRAHRLIWEELIGPLTKKDSLHHKCGIKICVNPQHLEKVSFAEHNKIHQTGRKMNISEKERQRRVDHGKEMIHHAQEKSYSKRTRHDVAKQMWLNRTPEQRAEIGKKISAAKRGDA